MSQLVKILENIDNPYKIAMHLQSSWMFIIGCVSFVHNLKFPACSFYTWRSMDFADTLDSFSKDTQTSTTITHWEWFATDPVVWVVNSSPPQGGAPSNTGVGWWIAPPHRGETFVRVHDTYIYPWWGGGYSPSNIGVGWWIAPPRSGGLFTTLHWRQCKWRRRWCQYQCKWRWRLNVDVTDADGGASVTDPDVGVSITS